MFLSRVGVKPRGRVAVCVSDAGAGADTVACKLALV